jgi:hypothetical protein
MHVDKSFGHKCVEMQGVEMLILIGGLCSVGFLKPVGVLAGFHVEAL